MPKYRGSLIAKQIIDDREREKRDKARALKLKALREAYEERKRGDTEWQKKQKQGDLRNTIQ
jgi:hypothetical protein